MSIIVVCSKNDHFYYKKGIVLLTKNIVINGLDINKVENRK